MKCTICNTELKENTTAYSNEVCIPCNEDRSLFNDPSKNIRNFSLHLDGQCIDIEMLKDSQSYVDYSVTSALWDIDPRFRSRHVIAGSSTGILRIDKFTGEIDTVYPILHDTGKVAAVAKKRLQKHFEEGIFPQKTGFYSG